MDVYIPKDYYTKKPKGIAFVQFPDADEAADAEKALDGTQLCGVEVSVQVALQKRKDPQFFQRGRGGGRGGGGGGYRAAAAAAAAATVGTATATGAATGTTPTAAGTGAATGDTTGGTGPEIGTTGGTGTTTGAAGTIAATITGGTGRPRAGPTTTTTGGE